ncbi:hypothetical protein CQW23_31570 [Capsicum baccatum]|uniref:Geraniol 8-hydroxylase n=1 Tax=Capsicum baccatum TaxID=33114 RepID=A0A2G2V787_CAPBA|nr:hypothetical protein CQW23_31570 [Capsicum baccatum]
MDCYTLVFGSIFTLSFLYIIAKLSSKSSEKLPPGPTPWPIIGNLHLLGAKSHASLANLAKRYGPITSLKLGQTTAVVISSSSIAKQVVQKQDLAFSSRFILDALQAQNHYQFSVAWLPVCPQCTLFSKDMDDPFSDSKVDELKDAVSGIVDVAGKINLVDYFPILEKIDPQRIRYRANIHLGKLFKLFGDLINERLEEKKRNHSEKNDILEVFLNHSAENPEEINQNHLESMLLDLFIGGIDTTTGTLEWAMAEILGQPEIVKKAQAELAEVVGKGKPIEEADVSRLRYLQFIMKETLRTHPPAPFLIPRRVDQDVELYDYVIPKGSIILVNAWAIGRDSSFWQEDSLLFKPERFRSLELDVQGKDFALIPFGAGRRICPGFPLALKLVPVMLGSMLNSFNWKLDADIEPKDLNMEEKFGAIVTKAHPLRAIPSPL